METRLVDYSYARPSAAQVKAVGSTGVFRYSSRNPAKALTPAEAATIRAAGLWLGVVFEDSKTRTLEGFAAGREDALFAAAQAVACGVPTTCPIAFTVDSNYTVAQVLGYFQGIASANIANPIMVYGGIRIVEGIRMLGLARYGWQTAAWSNDAHGVSLISPLADLYQRNAGVVAPLAGTDENVLLHPLPLWGAPGGHMPLIYPGAVWRPIDSHGGPMAHEMGPVEHITTNDFDPYGFFSNPANKASSHLWISLTGLVEQYISLDLASWAQAGGNGGWTSVEIAGVEGTPKTPAQVESFAKLFAWGSNEPSMRWPLRLTDSPDIGGLGWHGMGGDAWGGHQYCPGSARRAQRPAVLARAQQLASGVTPIPAPKPAPTEDFDMAKRYLASDGKTQIVADSQTKRIISDLSEVDFLIKSGMISAAPPEPLTSGSAADTYLRKLAWATKP